MTLDNAKIEEFLQETEEEMTRLDAQYADLAKAAEEMKPFYEKMAVKPDISELAREAKERAEIEGSRRKDAIKDKLGVKSPNLARSLGRRGLRVW